MFANDLLLFGRANSNAISKIKEMLESYEKWSNHQINFQKSIHFSRNVRQEKKEELLTMMEVQSMKKSEKYLDSH